MAEHPVAAGTVARVRLFFALWPDESVRRQLADAVAANEALRRLAGRPVPVANFHLTLAFLGSVPAAQLADIKRAARRVRCRRFALDITDIDYFPGAKIVWAGPADCPAALRELVDDLWVQLASLGDEPGLRREPRSFKPHISLVRNVSGGIKARLAAPLRWPVDGFALVRSASSPTGSAYTLLEQYSADD